MTLQIYSKCLLVKYDKLQNLRKNSTHSSESLHLKAQLSIKYHDVTER